jgi:hypothetical protein
MANDLAERALLLTDDKLKRIGELGAHQTTDPRQAALSLSSLVKPRAGLSFGDTPMFGPGVGDVRGGRPFRADAE